MKHASGILLLLAVFLAAPAAAQPLVVPDQMYFGGGRIGLDVDTDATVFGVMFGSTNVFSGVAVAVALEYGIGSEDISLPGGGGGSLDYNVVQAHVNLMYPVAVSDSAPIVVYPLAGPRFYRFSFSDCDFSECEASEATLNVGAGVMYDRFGVEVFTGLGGDVPDFGARLLALFGL